MDAMRSLMRRLPVPHHEVNALISESCAAAAEQVPGIDALAQELADNFRGLGIVSARELLATIGLCLNGDLRALQQVQGKHAP